MSIRDSDRHCLSDPNLLAQHLKDATEYVRKLELQGRQAQDISPRFAQDYVACVAKEQDIREALVKALSCAGELRCLQGDQPGAGAPARESNHVEGGGPRARQVEEGGPTADHVKERSSLYVADHVTEAVTEAGFGGRTVCNTAGPQLKGQINC